MPGTPAIEVPVTLDLGPAADALMDLAVALEVTAAFLKSKVEDLRRAPAREHFRTAGRQLIEDFLAAGAVTPADIEAVLEAASDAAFESEAMDDAREVIASDAPDRFETEDEAEDPGDDEPAPGPAVELAVALKHTQEYVGDELLPRLAGWSWFDALTKYFPAMLEEEAVNELRAEDPDGATARTVDIEITD
jgi:hypothetical protein